MFLKKLQLTNYKNFPSKSFAFHATINCLAGNNGIGKTNVLDAIYHLSLGKSYFNPIVSQNILHEADFFRIEGGFEKNGREENLVCTLQRGQRTLLKRNEKLYEKISDHVGFIPVVMVSPADSNLIEEGSDIRRKFMDEIISQSDKGYLQDIIHYHRVLAQRNSLLKYFALNAAYNPETIAIYDRQLNDYGTTIFKKREMFMNVFIPIFRDQYTRIAGAEETVNLRYESCLFESSLEELLSRHISRDKSLQYTSVGIHKDDMVFQIQGYPIKKFGSQGQQKSFLIALKMAQYNFIKAQTGIRPILLLDDIFDKLDEGRVAKWVDLVKGAPFGQIFITDTHPERIEAIVRDTKQLYEVFTW